MTPVERELLVRLAVNVAAVLKSVPDSRGENAREADLLIDLAARVGADVVEAGQPMPKLMDMN